MKHDFPDYIRDMNHDGKIDTRDSALFHEMLDENQTEVHHTSPRSHCGNDISDQVIGAFVKGILIFIMGGFLALLIQGVFPVNILTFFLAVFCASGIVRVLLL